MTLNAFIKELQKLQKKGHGKSHVTVDVRHFASVSDDYSHFSVAEVSTDVIRFEKDDSFFLADGSERMKAVVVLS
jgi:hypothetical protein